MATRGAGEAAPQHTAPANLRRRTLVVALSLVPMALVMLYFGVRGTNFDFAIYQGALTDVLHGRSAYDFTAFLPETGEHMGFIYPPFASLVMLPLAVVPEAVGRIAMAVLSTLLVIAALIGCIRVIDGRRRLAGRRRLSLLACAIAALVLAVSTPAVSNMALGQVSFAIAALVLLDVLVLPQRWRGTLVGLAGAIKLTPMILVPYYLVTRQWRAALTASITFGAATVIGAAFRWSDSIRYWLHPDVVRSTLGTLGRTDNWSIYGVLARIHLGGVALTGAWLVLSAVVVGIALWRARRHFRAGQLVEATLVMGLAAALVTVATWPHHVLFLMVACLLVAIQRPVVGFLVLVGFTLACYVIPDTIGNWAVLLMAVLVGVGIRDLRRSGVDRPPDAPTVAEPPTDPVALATQ